MRLRILALLLPLLAVGGCSTLGNVGTVLTLNQPQFLTNDRLYQIHSAYEVFQATALSIRTNFRQCSASEARSPTNICYKRSEYLAIQGIDRQAAQTVANIDAWATNNPTIDAGALIDAFNRVIGQGTALVTSIQSGR